MCVRVCMLVGDRRGLPGIAAWVRCVCVCVCVCACMGACMGACIAHTHISTLARASAALRAAVPRRDEEVELAEKK
jgi:hypothetical protein